VVLPAEGVYGFHAHPGHDAALEALRAMKERDAGKGWILLVEGAGALARMGVAIPPRAGGLIERHWPGALTLVLTVSDAALPPSLRSPDGTIAVRAPGNAFLLDVVRASGGLLVSTSANRAGAPAPSRLADAALDGVSFAVDGGALSGIPSTLVRVDGSTVRVLRSGAVPDAALAGDEA
jgi:tRNA threonylcarbamoyl adenosine modification protein (Sua5/YciO/YrdC/YwlC family)